MSVSLATVLAESALRRPDHPALVTDAVTLTYRQLWSGARRHATVLRRHGIGPGDRVALLLPNSPEFPMAYFGALALGATVVPLPTTLRAGEIGYVLTDSAAAVLVRADGPGSDAGVEAADATGTPVLTLTGDFARDAEPIPGPVPRAPEDVALILYTSGTTGRPKGTMLTHLSVFLNVELGRESPFAMVADDVLLGCLPLFHTFGQICGMATTFRAGATMVLMDRFDGPRAVRLMAAHGCTVLMGVPTMYHALLAATEHGPVPPLDRAFSGGSALPVAVLETFEERFGCPVYEGYGLTEASPVVAYNQPAWPRRPGTVGRPIWGVEVVIARADVDDRVEPVPVGEIGEIVVRGHNVMAGYLNHPEATATTVVDGWLRSGDLGLFDADGYLRVVDRKKDLVIRGGFNVYPRELEETLIRHPAVAQCAVIGVPHPTLGEEVCAVVVPRPADAADGELPGRIVAWCRERMAGHKYPRLVVLTDALPLGASGKVLKRELVARYAAPGALP
ncbi:long-chain fatty acid--CoA ligase [Micromonospora sp. WMMD882]|uniref:long-chain-fatty-acid--CoA ligase n=1 Tax=Micromonospora sp. WMMD882 TaxID=3015151 RepID=UPI00248B8EBF|nr:long-chain fatty acid--CoA ligase [Micromonospora sp. WMMD882]WBB80363.1 long-chain fatty acid--CoA ligase [Micromonospora sp. WMMD882]